MIHHITYRKAVIFLYRKMVLCLFIALLTVLHENNMPVEMVRVILTRQQLPKDFTTSWRFYKL